MPIDLAPYRIAVVTGPQRSGTTFAAKAIAGHNGWDYIDEDVYGVHNRRQWAHLVNTRTRAVIQCPTMMRYVHDLPADVLVVVMRRNVADILASQDRISWSDEHWELDRYPGETGHACEIKYRWWDAHKHAGPPCWIELEYDQLSSHPAWVPSERRRDFAPRQTEIV